MRRDLRKRVIYYRFKRMFVIVSAPSLEWHDSFLQNSFSSSRERERERERGEKVRTKFYRGYDSLQKFLSICGGRSTETCLLEYMTRPDWSLLVLSSIVTLIAVLPVGRWRRKWKPICLLMTAGMSVMSDYGGISRGRRVGKRRLAVYILCVSFPINMCGKWPLGKDLVLPVNINLKVIKVVLDEDRHLYSYNQNIKLKK